ncbi:MAG: tyrosine-type recombinase/integrase [Candidatus Aminicenantes bacterium]|nr:tyrosine-type recombinase/integrase [Candidatus Aminicenantes bacterium]
MRIYQRDKTWYVDYYYEGRRIRKKIGSKRDAENALAAIKADILRGEYRFKKDRKVRFEDFAKEYLEYAKINKRSWTRDESSLKRLLSFFGDMLLSKISARHIEEYKKMRLEKVKTGTINRELACLKHMFTIAEKLGRFDDKNPVKQVEFFQERQYVMKILDREEINRLIDAAADHLKPILIIALNTGMRRGEIFNLRWSDIDFIDHYIHIKKTKSNVMRNVPMNSVVATTLKNIEKKSEFIFPSLWSKKHKHINDVFNSFKTACSNAGIKDLRFHDLRHTAATLMVTGGVDLATVSQILGHSTIQMTMKYAHPTPENKRSAVNVLASIFESKKEEKPVTIWSQAEIEKAINPLLSKS